MRDYGQQMLGVGMYASASRVREQEDSSSHDMGTGISAEGGRELRFFYQVRELTQITSMRLKGDERRR